MRFAGHLHKWNEERGFGFIRPVDGGQDVFVHISSLPRPVPGPEEILTFGVALNQDGKKKAVDVRLQRVEQAGLAEDRRRSGRSPSSEPNYHALGRYEPRHHESRRRSSWPGAVVVLVVLASIGAYAFKRSNLTMRSEAAPQEVSLPVPSSTKSSRFQCDGRTTCGQMTSCEEATYFLQNCPGVKMDGNNDGIPCERQWCQ